jgi:hypothetical protein
MEETFCGQFERDFVCMPAGWNICMLVYEGFDWVTSELMRSAADEDGP